MRGRESACVSRTVAKRNFTTATQSALSEPPGASLPGVGAARAGKAGPGPVVCGVSVGNSDPAVLATILAGEVREICRRWPPQSEVTVKGVHFGQEDSPDEIGRAIAEWRAKLA